MDRPEPTTTTDEIEDEDDQDDEGDSQTESTSKRHWLTNDGIAWLLAIAYIALLFAAGLDWIHLGDVPEIALLAFIAAFGTAVAWAFGADAVRAWRGDQ